MELRDVDPDTVVPDAMNARSSTEMDSEFVEHVREVGIIHPPMVRELEDGTNYDAGARYTVVAGWRRVTAASEAELDEIPAIVVDWNDGEALSRSISENIELFRKDLTAEDSANALEQLSDLKDIKTVSDMADELGVSRKTVLRLSEANNDFWEEVKEACSGAHLNADASTLEETRSVSDSPSEGARVLKTVRDENLGKRDLQEARDRKERGDKSTDEALQEVVEEKKEKQSSGIKVRAEVTFIDDAAEAVESAAKDNAMSNEQVIRRAVETWLTEEGYL